MPNKMSAQHKAMQCASAFPNYVLKPNGNTWKACVDPVEIWNPIFKKWQETKITNSVSAGQTPSEAIRHMWDYVTGGQVGVFRKVGDDLVWVYNPQAFVFNCLDPSDSRYPTTPESDEVPDWPDGWNVKSQPDDLEKQAVGKYGDGIPVNGKYMTVGDLKNLVSQIDSYVETKVKMPAEILTWQKTLKQHGIYKKDTPIGLTVNHTGSSNHMDTFIKTQMEKWATQ